MEVMKKKRPSILWQMVMLCILVSVSWGLTGCGSRERGEEESASTEETPVPEPSTEAIRIEQTEAEPETMPEPEPEPYTSPIDFEALWAINPDVIGWIKVEGTNIDYPILYGPDNEKYLHTDLEGNTTTAGSIFLDCDDQPDFTSLHNVLYGHHMKNGSMFKDVVYYKEQDFFDAHQQIVLYTPEREIHLRPLAALYTSADSIRRKTAFKSWRGFKTYVKAMTQDALTSGAPKEPIRRLYSLVTCSYEFNNARTILYAYEVGEGGAESRPRDDVAESRREDGAAESGMGESRQESGDLAEGIVGEPVREAGTVRAADGGTESRTEHGGWAGEDVDMESWERYWAMEEKTYRRRLVPHPALLPEV